MPQYHKKKSERGQTDQDTINLAVAEYIEAGKRGLRTIAKKHGIPKSSFERYVKGETCSKLSDRVKQFGSRYVVSQIFTVAEENELSEYIVTSAYIAYGLSKVEVRELAYLYAIANNKIVPKNWAGKKMAGEKWLEGFMHRHQRLSVRKPEATSLSRCTNFNKKNVGEFFDNLESLLTRFHFLPGSIYNCDETALMTVQKPKKVVAPKGVKQLNKVTSAERGTLVTLLGTISASGNFMPPFYVFPRARFLASMVDRAPPGATGCAKPTGWMCGPAFVEYLTHFKNHAKPSKEAPVLLLFDNHESHITVESLNFCKENFIHLLSFPPHCTDKLQPLDVSVYGALKAYYDTTVDRWLRLHPGRAVTIHEVGELSSGPFLQAFTPANILAGFKKTGIYPFNRDIFTETEFLRASVTDRPDPTLAINGTVPQQKVQAAKAAQPNMPGPAKAAQPNMRGPATQLPNVPGPATQISNLPGPSSQPQGQSNLSEVPAPSDSSAAELQSPSQAAPSTPNCQSSAPGSSQTPKNRFSASDVLPYPKAGERKRKGGRQPLKTQILTDTPTKIKVLAELQARKERKEQKKSRKRAKKALEFDDPQENISDNEDEMEILYQESGSSEESFSENEDEFYDRNDRDFSVDNFVLVEFSTKQVKVYYIGKILTADSDLYSVKFLRRKRQTNYFTFPNIDDICEIKEKDIICKLQTAQQKGGTERTGHIFFFDYSTLFAELGNIR